MNRFAEYTTDELRGMFYAAKDFSIEVEDLIAEELRARRDIRNAWLDYCNAVAGEVIA